MNRDGMHAPGMERLRRWRPMRGGADSTGVELTGVDAGRADLVLDTVRLLLGEGARV